MQKNRYASGFSLLELIVAIAVAGIIMTLGFTAYSHVVKGFRHQGSHAERVRKMLITKKQIDNTFSKINSIESWTEYSLKYRTEGSDSVLTIQFRNNSLLKGNASLCDNISHFKIDKKSDTEGNSHLFFWEGLLGKNDWIGGFFFAEN